MKLKSLFATFIYYLMQGIRPLLGPEDQCGYTITCTRYIRMQLEEQPLHKALWDIIRRLASCGPLRFLQ